MAGHQHLFLRTIHLGPAEVWTNDRGGDLLFLFPKSGDGKFVSGPTTQRIGPGDVIVVNAAYPGTFSPLDGKELIFAFFSACMEHLFPLLASHEILILEHVTDEIKRPLWFAATHPIAVEVNKLIAEAIPESTLEHRGRLLRVVTTILSPEFKSVHGRIPEQLSPRDNLLRVLEHLPVSDLLSLSVEDLADRCNCSRRHLSRLFHQHFKFSVGALKMEIRLLKTVSLLRDPSAKVINVAQECGFKNQSLFNAYFKRRFGMSPGQWQKTTIAAESSGNQSSDSDCGCPNYANGLCPFLVLSRSCDSLVRSLCQTIRQPLGAPRP
jgi:AraC-like DNA-binding protein